MASESKRLSIKSRIKKAYKPEVGYVSVLQRTPMNNRQLTAVQIDQPQNRVTILDLTNHPDQTMPGKFLLCRIIVPARVLMSAMHTVVQDPDAQLSLHLAVFNFTTSDNESALCPVGSVLCVKNPRFMTNFGGEMLVSCDAMDVAFIPPDDNNFHKFVGDISWQLEDEAKECLKYGHSCHEEQRFLTACHFYRKCLNINFDLDGDESHDKLDQCLDKAKRKESVSWNAYLKSPLNASLTDQERCDQSSGIYDMTYFVKNRDLAFCNSVEYLGPVVLGNFGVKATALITAGQMVMAKKCLARYPTDPSAEYDLKGVTFGRRWSQKRDQTREMMVKSCVEHLIRYPDTIEKMNALSDSDSKNLKGVLDIERVHKICAKIAFHVFCSHVRNESEHSLVSSGIWIEPSYLHHSCENNCSYVIVNEFLFVKAIRDIQPEAELLINFLPRLMSHQKKVEELKRLGVTCDCKICQAERHQQEFTSAIGY